MDELLPTFENLKVSAFTKLNLIRENINSVTIGPNRSILEAPDTIDNIKTVQTSTPKKTEKPQLQRNSDDFPQTPLNQFYKELEVKRKEEVGEALAERYNKFCEFFKVQNEEIQTQSVSRHHNLNKSSSEMENKILQLMCQPTNRGKSNEKLVKHQQDMVRRKLEYEQQLEKKREKQRILNENIEKVRECQTVFGVVYQEIIQLIKDHTSSEDLKGFLGEALRNLKLLHENLEQLITKCKTYVVDNEDVKNALNLVVRIKNLEQKIDETVTKIIIKEKEEQEKLKHDLQLKQQQLQQEQQRQEQQRQQQLLLQHQHQQQQQLATQHQQNAEMNNSAVLKIEQCISPVNLRKYVEIKQFLEQYLQTCKVLEDNPELKQFRFDCKKAVNIPVNAISAVSSEHLKDKYNKLSNLLAGKTVIVADNQINATRFPQGVAFCTNLLAKKFVLQGDLMISSNPDAAFCYATIIISLWNEYPDFGKLLLAYFFTQCPYLIPFYIPKSPEQTNEKYYESLGYHYIDGQVEKQDKFLKRMTGIFRLYFAIFISRPKREQSKNPHGISNAWNFLASILKLEPQLDVTATALHTFLETVGYEMDTVYGSSFKKLLKIIDGEFLIKVKKIDTGGPVSRLERLLQEYKTKGYFEKPHGVLPLNFW